MNESTITYSSTQLAANDEHPAGVEATVECVHNSAFISDQPILTNVKTVACTDHGNWSEQVDCATSTSVYIL